MARESKDDNKKYRRPLGYFEARRAAKDLKAYFDLIKIFYHFSDPDERSELLKLFPQFKGDGSVADNRSIKVELNKLSVKVHWALLRIHAPVNYTVEHTDSEYDIDQHKNIKTKRKVHLNIILDQHQPNFRKDISIIEAYEILVNTMEQSIPIYESYYKNYWKRLINPLWVIAMIMRTPISILEHMGIDTSTHETNKFVVWLMQAIILIALALLCLWLGLPLAAVLKP